MRFYKKTLIWDILSFAGFVLYLNRIYRYIHLLPAMLDEGTYLYKGLLFVEGVYKPFQAYGLWTNKMPYLFYLFGILQKVFEPGLATGRYFALALSALLLLALWLGIRYFIQPFWGAVAVWILALSPLTGIVYAYATSEIVVGAFLAFALSCLMGEHRSEKALICSVFWFALIALMRAHMVVLGFFALIYIYRYHGKKVFWQAAAAWSGLVFMGYALYWPEIGRLWQGVMPSFLLRYLPDKIPSFTGAISAWALATQNISLFSRLYAISVALISEIFIIVGQILGSLYLISAWYQTKKLSEARKMQQPSNSFPEKKWTSYWLTTFVPAYFLYYGIFVWNVFAHNYCIDCLKVYARFITPLGLINLIVLLATIEPIKKLWLDGLIVLNTLAIGALTGLSVWESLGIKALYFPVPKFWEGKFFQHTTIWSILENKFHVSYNIARALSPILLGLFFAICLIVFLLLLYKTNIFGDGQSYGYLLLISSLVIILVFIATNYQEERACAAGFDALVSEKYIGTALNESIEKNNALVYWAGGRSISLLLYLHNIKTFPQQYNGAYGQYINGDVDTLMKYGFFNEQSDENWRHTADYFVISNENMPNFKSVIAEEHLMEIPMPPDALGCSQEARIHLFVRDATNE